MTERLEEGRDFYLENGLMVLTAHFLQQRGYCCKSGCRHCPYGKKEVTVDSSVEVDQEDANK